MERSYRQSAVKKFKRCRRSFDLGYHRNLELKHQSVSVATTGTLVHAGLQNYYLHKDPLDGVRQAWEEAAAEVSSLQLPDLQKSYDLARIMVDGYIDWQAQEGLDQGWDVLAVEERLELPIGVVNGDDVVLTGQLDLLIKDASGAVYVIDDKTCDTFTRYQFNIQMSEQLLFYDMLVRHVKGLTPAGAVYNMLRRVKRTGSAKPPFYAREVVRFNNVQRHNYENQLLGIVADMVAAEQAVERDPALHQSSMYPNPTSDCSWDCSFLPVCSMRDTGEAFEDAVADLYTERTPVEITKKDVA